MHHRIPIEQVCIGLHIKLDNWLGHPFLLSSFKVKNQKQIAALKSMGLKEIEYLPQKNDTRPVPSPTPTPQASRTARSHSRLFDSAQTHLLFRRSWRRG